MIPRVLGELTSTLRAIRRLNEGLPRCTCTCQVPKHGPIFSSNNLRNLLRGDKIPGWALSPDHRKVAFALGRRKESLGTNGGPSRAARSASHTYLANIFCQVPLFWCPKRPPKSRKCGKNTHGGRERCQEALGWQRKVPGRPVTAPSCGSRRPL